VTLPQIVDDDPLTIEVLGSAILDCLIERIRTAAGDDQLLKAWNRHAPIIASNRKRPADTRHDVS
jgi:hypothetical protein